jgi:hypothetical protein
MAGTRVHVMRRQLDAQTATRRAVIFHVAQAVVLVALAAWLGFGSALRAALSSTMIATATASVALASYLFYRSRVPRSR